MTIIISLTQLATNIYSMPKNKDHADLSYKFNKTTSQSVRRTILSLVNTMRPHCIASGGESLLSQTDHTLGMILHSSFVLGSTADPGRQSVTACAILETGITFSTRILHSK
jgi:hypothetical protein